MSELKNVTYYSASAGTGKTYTLTNLMAEEINDKGVKLDEIILTTFTKAAANDFKRKCREGMLRNGLPDACANLDLVKMGTIDSISQFFVQKYWYYLGISPDIQTLEEDAQSQLVDKLMEHFATREESEWFFRFVNDFDIKKMSTSNGKMVQLPNYDFWKDAVKKIADYAESYGIESLEESKVASIDNAKKYYKGDTSPIIDKEKLDVCLDAMTSAVNATPKIKKDDWLNIIETVRALGGKECLSDEKKVIKELLTKFKKHKTLGDLDCIADLEACIPEFYRFPTTQEKVVECIERIFDMTVRWRKIYREYKANNRVIDFVDMETMFSELLEKKEVIQDIKDNYKVLMVDEFQDSSPLQLSLFYRLAKLVERCYWVGDAKQSIYGFRGTDFDLVQSVMAKIDKENIKHRTTCYRSVPSIVDFVNKYFVPTFNEGREESQKEIEVDPVKGSGESEDDGVYLCGLKYDPPLDFFERIAGQVEQEVRKDPSQTSEIAVLLKEWKDIYMVAANLARRGIPVKGTGNLLWSTDAFLVLVSLLRLVVNANDDLAKAEIAYLVEKGYTTSKIVQQRIDGEKSEFLKDVSLIKKFMALRPTLLGQSVKSIVETLVIELDLNSAVAFMEDSPSAIFGTVVSTAEVYEGLCAAKNSSASVAGFIDYLVLHKELRSIGDPTGVTVTTYHKSKGLEWNKVFVASLDRGTDKASVFKKDFLGVRVCKKADFAVENMGKTTLIQYIPQVFKADLPNYILESLNEDLEFKKCWEDKKQEQLRLLYVGMTRAKKQLHILKDCNNTAPMDWVKFVGIGNIEEGLKEESPDVAVDKASYLKKVPKYVGAPDYTERKPRDILPSSTYGTIEGEVEIALDSAEKVMIPVDWKSFEPDQMNEVGTCIHNIFAGLDSQEDRLGYAKSIIESQDMQKRLPNAESGIVAAWERFEKFLAATYGPSVETYHELPFVHLIDGQIVKGSMDFVWKTATGVVLVDFKNLHIGSYKHCLEAGKEHYLGKYKGQFDCYQKALEAHGEKILDRVIYQPITGRVVRIK